MVTGVGVPIHRLSRKTTEDTETPQKTQKFFLCVLCASLRLCVTLGVLGVNLFAPSAPLLSLHLCVTIHRLSQIYTDFREHPQILNCQSSPLC